MASDSLMAVLATILPGLAGPDAWLEDSLGPSRLPKLNLLTATKDYRLQQLIERFTTSLETTQRRLVENMSRNSPDCLELVACGPYSNPNTFKLADPEMRDKSLKLHADILTRSSQSGATNALLLDLADDPIPPRIEAVLHSQFLMMGFETRKMKSEFDAELRVYESEIQQTASEAGPWAMGLPRTLFWALGFLRRALPENRRPDDECLMASSFAAARRLVKNHLDQVLLITQAELLKDRRRLARKIIKDVSDATSPMRFRDIARRNQDQRKERLSPVVDALLEVGVLVRDEEGFYTLGPVDLSDVQDIVDQMLAKP